MALRCEDCYLTRRIDGTDGHHVYVPDVDGGGAVKRGPITHAYSIASAPFETVRDGYLEFYVVLEKGEGEQLGRLTESLFREGREERLSYVDRITGDFTLEKRAAGASSVLLVGTGTGLAPFVSMIKQLDHEAQTGQRTAVRYTLITANRTRGELAYHDDLLSIEKRGAFDFTYIPSVSRPRPDDFADPQLGTGRANNLLRNLLGLPAPAGSQLPVCHPREKLLPRFPAGETVILTCGNAALMEDIRLIAEAVGFRFEKEDW
jgi:ferredoxin--NADP+ reductase